MNSEKCERVIDLILDEAELGLTAIVEGKFPTYCNAPETMKAIAELLKTLPILSTQAAIGGKLKEIIDDYDV